MSIKKSEIARCGACRFYTPVGRRGGECSQLSVPVQSSWKACCLVKPPFKKLATTGESDMPTFTQEPIAPLGRKSVPREVLPVKARRFPSKAVPASLESSQVC